MRGLTIGLVAALFPALGFAQSAVIRVDAKRGPEAAAEEAAEWKQHFDDVVMFDLPKGWVAIGLGPQSRLDAEARLAELRDSGEVPDDSFVAIPIGVELRPVQDPDLAALVMSTDRQDIQPGIAPSESYLLLQTLRSEEEGRNALTEWKKTFAEAGLWRTPDNRYVVTLGPLAEDVAAVWLPALKTGGVLPADSKAAPTGELGQAIEAGAAPNLAPPPTSPRRLPPLNQVQGALRWAGLYEGRVDGVDGPMTQNAINMQIARGRVSTDPGTAIADLIEKRTEWREQMGLTLLRDKSTGLMVTAPLDMLEFDRTEGALSIYGPKNESGAALILFSQPGGQQELIDISGLVTALGWVPKPERMIEVGHIRLIGSNDSHISRAEGWSRNGRAEGYVLIWPASDPVGQDRISAEMAQSLSRISAAANDPVNAAEAQAANDGGGTGAPNPLQ